MCRFLHTIPALCTPAFSSGNFVSLILGRIYRMQPKNGSASPRDSKSSSKKNQSVANSKAAKGLASARVSSKLKSKDGNGNGNGDGALNSDLRKTDIHLDSAGLASINAGITKKITAAEIYSDRHAGDLPPR